MDLDSEWENNKILWEIEKNMGKLWEIEKKYGKIMGNALKMLKNA